MSSRRRVVVTGLGLITSLGVSVSHNWTSLLAGKCGVVRLSDSKFNGIPCRIAAKVPEGTAAGHFDLSAIPPNQLRKSSRGILFSLAAANEALKDANWLGVAAEGAKAEDLEATGVAVGMGMADLDDICATGQLLKTGGYNKVSPYFVPRILTNMSAGQISIKYGFRGPNHSVSTACTSGAHSIGDAAMFIRYGRADVMVCGGSEACISPIAVAGFARLRALSCKFNETPLLASRPFDKIRDGFVIGEGAGILVLEELQHAKRRGAKIYGEILGYGLSGDANHETTPEESGRGAILSMTRAIQDAQIDPSAVEHVNTHATSTPIGDKVEISAIRSVLEGSGGPDVTVTSAKGAIGHLLGASGAVETIFAILSCHHGILPPTINFSQTDIDVGRLKIVANSPTKWHSANRVALKNSFGFGGTNASLLVSNYV